MQSAACKEIKGAYIRNMRVTYALGTHKRTVRSFEAEANVSPSGENCTSVTTPCVQGNMPCDISLYPMHNSAYNEPYVQ